MMRLFGSSQHLRHGMPMILVFLAFLTTQLYGGSLYSYVDENGVKVFTNIGVNRSDLVRKNEPEPFTANPSRSRYLQLINQSAKRFKVDANLVKAIVQVESHYNPYAISPKGCIGLMQLHPDTARRFGVQNAFDPAENILGGVKYLNFLMDYFNGNLSHVLAGYNAGENAVARYKGIPPYRETQEYVRKVMTLYQSFTPPEASVKRPSRQLSRLVLPNGSVLLTNQEPNSSMP
ncbi:lytic transglycosylase domain-containing protein [Acidobacteria bacterium AH-259-D05]|nr:lytic transglycosylase domain-containing protein [Acidobacteria bacterium AH-259-D05]